MNTPEPILPDPNVPNQSPGAPVDDPPRPDGVEEYSASATGVSTI